MLDIMKAIYDMMGKCTYPVLKEETPHQNVEIFFQASPAGGATHSTLQPRPIMYSIAVLLKWGYGCL